MYFSHPNLIALSIHSIFIRPIYINKWMFEECDDDWHYKHEEIYHYIKGHYQISVKRKSMPKCELLIETHNCMNIV
jgi:hypothetical protein